jgi:hypothetical protein
MRFSTFASFMLPLTALAAPTYQPSYQDVLIQKCELFLQALGETSNGLNATIALATTMSQQGVVDHAKKADEKIRVALNAALRMQAADKEYRPPAPNEYVITPSRSHNDRVKMINTAFFALQRNRGH